MNFACDLHMRIGYNKKKRWYSENSFLYSDSNSTQGDPTRSDVTGSHVTGSDVIGSIPDRNRKSRKWSRLHAQPVPALFSYYSSTKCIIAHDRHGYRMWRHVTPKGLLGRVCACATERCAISALVGPFDQKWHHQTWPIGLPLENMQAHNARNRKCPWSALYDVRVLFIVF
jgi:hypothetical protein